MEQPIARISRQTQFKEAAKHKTCRPYILKAVVVQIMITVAVFTLCTESFRCVARNPNNNQHFINLLAPELFS
jgi:hypothetical protein